MKTLERLSPLDNRYSELLQGFSCIFSEEGFIRERAFVEQQWFKKLASVLGLKGNFGKFMAPLTLRDIETIKKIELHGSRGVPATQHDLKAIEYFLRTRLPPRLREYVHFGLTSEDCENLALGLMLKKGLQEFVLPSISSLSAELLSMARMHKGCVMLGRTHGQPASPTTFGKEILVFASRLGNELGGLEALKIPGKLSGAVGTYSALKAARPEINWVEVSADFVASLGLNPISITTQILPHEGYVKIFHSIHRINSILLDLSRDIWLYASYGLLRQKPSKGSVGSSVMPHKINPVSFENAEGNLELANSILECLCRELPLSRLQRDLSDKTLKRNIGVAFGHGLVAYASLRKGLSEIEPDKGAMFEELNSHPEVLSEAYQTVLREHIPNAYEKLAEFTRGKKVTLEMLHNFLEKLDIPDEVRGKLKVLTPEKYIGETNELFRFI